MTIIMVRNPPLPRTNSTQVSLAAMMMPPSAGMAIRVACQMMEFSATALMKAGLSMS